MKSRLDRARLRKFLKIVRAVGEAAMSWPTAKFENKTEYQAFRTWYRKTGERQPFRERHVKFPR